LAVPRGPVHDTFVAQASSSCQSTPGQSSPRALRPGALHVAPGHRDLFELAGYRIQRLAALRAALAIRLVELVDLVDDGQTGVAHAARAWDGAPAERRARPPARAASRSMHRDLFVEQRRVHGGLLEDWLVDAGTGVSAPIQRLRYIRWRRGGTRYELLTNVLAVARLSEGQTGRRSRAMGARDSLCRRSTRPDRLAHPAPRDHRTTRPGAFASSLLFRPRSLLHLGLQGFGRAAA